MTRSLDGQPVTEHHGHVGWPVDPVEVLWRVQCGLPVYFPRDPVMIDQAPYRRFAAERGPNSA